MIKTITKEQIQSLSLSVYLKDGREFLACDTTERPFGEHGNVVAFWQQESVYVVPISEVREIVMIFDQRT